MEDCQTKFCDIFKKEYNFFAKPITQKSSQTSLEAGCSIVLFLLFILFAVGSFVIISLDESTYQYRIERVDLDPSSRFVESKENSDEIFEDTLLEFEVLTLGSTGLLKEDYADNFAKTCVNGGMSQSLVEQNITDGSLISDNSQRASEFVFGKSCYLKKENNLLSQPLSQYSLNQYLDSIQGQHSRTFIEFPPESNSKDLYVFIKIRKDKVASKEVVQGGFLVSLPANSPSKEVTFQITLKYKSKGIGNLNLDEFHAEIVSEVTYQTSCNSSAYCNKRFLHIGVDRFVNVIYDGAFVEVILIEILSQWGGGYTALHAILLLSLVLIKCLPCTKRNQLKEDKTDTELNEIS